MRMIIHGDNNNVIKYTDTDPFWQNPRIFILSCVSWQRCHFFSLCLSKIMILFAMFVVAVWCEMEKEKDFYSSLMDSPTNWFESNKPYFSTSSLFWHFPFVTVIIILSPFRIIFIVVKCEERPLRKNKKNTHGNVLYTFLVLKGKKWKSRKKGNHQ